MLGDAGSSRGSFELARLRNEIDSELRYLEQESDKLELVFIYLNITSLNDEKSLSSSLSDQSIQKLKELVTQILEINKKDRSGYSSLKDEEAFDLLSMIDINFSKELEDVQSYQPLSSLDKSFIKLDEVLLLEQKDLRNNSRSKTSSVSTASRNKLKKFILATLMQAKEFDFDTGSKTLLRYSDPSHDIDDPMLIAKEMIATVFFGGNTLYRISGHNPYVSVKMHQDLYHAINEIRGELIAEISQSNVLNQDFKKFVLENCSAKNHQITFIPYLVADDIKAPQMRVGSQDFFGNELPESYKDRLAYLSLSYQTDYLENENAKHFKESAKLLTSYQDQSQRFELSVVSKIDANEAQLVGEFAKSLKFSQKLFTTQGSQARPEGVYQGGDYNLTLLSHNQFNKLMDGFDQVVCCGSDFTKVYGLGKILPSQGEQGSFMSKVVDNLVESYQDNKEVGWLLAGLPIRKSKDVDLENCLADQAYGLSFLGILALKNKGYSFSSFSARGFAKDVRQRDYSAVMMSPLRVLGEHMRKDEFGNMITQSIKPDTVQGSNKVIFSDDSQKQVAVDFCDFYEKSENAILESFWQSLDDQQKTILGFTNFANSQQAQNIDELKTRLLNFFDETAHVENHQAIVNKLTTAINQQHQNDNPVDFYKKRLASFRSENPQFSRPSLAYDTAVSALSSLVFKDPALHGLLLEIQEHGSYFQDFNQEYGSYFQDFNQDQQKALVINLELMNKLKAVDSDSSANIKIKQFYEKVEKLLNSLNDPILCPQSVINRNIRRDLSSKVSANISHVEISEEDKKFLYSSFVVNEKIYLPIYGKDKSYREMPDNDFAKFIAQSIDKPEAGYNYLPYFDENGQARLLRGAEDHSLLSQNEYQIKIFSEINQPLNYFKFQASTPSIPKILSADESLDSDSGQDSQNSQGRAIYVSSRTPIARVEEFLDGNYLVYNPPIFDDRKSRQSNPQNSQGTRYLRQHQQTPKISVPIEPPMSVCDSSWLQYPVPVSLQPVIISVFPPVNSSSGNQPQPHPQPALLPHRSPRSAFLSPRSALLSPRSALLSPRSALLSPRSALLSPRSPGSPRSTRSALL